MPANNIIETIIDRMATDGEAKTYPKGSMIVAEGQVERSIYYIESGAVRAFILTALEEQTIRLGYKGSIINSLSSFLSGRPSEMYLEAIRKTTVRTLSKVKFRQIIHENSERMQQYIELAELLITQQIDREIDLLTASPTERLKRVLDRSPNLFQEIPLKYIASYLRMTPETLSRIRNP